MINRQTVRQLLAIAAIPQCLNRRALVIAGVFARKVNRVICRTTDLRTVDCQRTHKLTVFYGSLACNVRNAMYNEMSGADLYLVAFFDESL